MRRHPLDALQAALAWLLYALTLVLYAVLGVLAGGVLLGLALSLTGLV